MQSECDIIVWDSSVIIDAIQKTNKRYDLIKPFIQSAERNHLTIVVSEVSIVEVTYLDKNRHNENLPPTDQEIQIIDEWFENDYIDRRPVLPGISELAREYIRNYNVRTMDSIIVATAVFFKIPLLHTFDGYSDIKTKRKKNKLLTLDGKLGTPALRIRVPDNEEDIF